jgi:signal transduction histidine kinase
VIFALAVVLLALLAAGVAALLALRRRRRNSAAAERAKRLARLENEHSLLRNTLENIGEGLSVFAPDGRLIAWNSRFVELLDLGGVVGPGTPLRKILLHQAIRGDFGDVEPEEEASRRLEAFRRDVPMVRERTTQKGRILRLRRSALRDGSVLTLYDDVTELKESERKQILARSQAEFANRSKSDFLANMSHELRTPLNAIIGFSEVIANEIFGPIRNPKYLEYLNDIHDSSLHLLSIINDVLDMSKIEAGRLELCKETVRIRTVVRDAVRMVEKRAEESGIELVTDLSDEDGTIWADERALKQIFLNLLSNSVKFSKSGSKVTIRGMINGSSFASFEVEDSGVGMTEEELHRALQPFGQARAATTRNYGGTGLGLPITKGLVEAHGGTLAIASHPGSGTLVRVLLPLAESWLDRAAE